jgi:hypothetical protein
MNQSLKKWPSIDELNAELADVQRYRLELLLE